MENRKPRFSVIIPTFARPHQLQRCLSQLGILNYPRDKFEVIVVDDGSPEPVDGIVASFQDAFRARPIRQVNQGPAAARNTGARAAAGEYLVFTDDDCLPDRRWLCELDRILTEEPRCLVGGGIVNALPENPFSTATQAITTAVYNYYDHHSSRERFFNTSNLAMPAACFRELGGFNESLRTGEDYDFCHRWQHSGRPLRHAPAAVVLHAHLITFWGFCRQHFNYGRGLLRFRLLAAQRAGRVIRSERPSFYLHLLTYPMRQWRGWRGWLYGGLIALSQAVAFAGACSEVLTRSFEWAATTPARRPWRSQAPAPRYSAADISRCDSGRLRLRGGDKMSAGPFVSVVIPTYLRPHMCLRAVRSALEQTLREIEVIVVVDGQDDATVQVLDQINDRRLHIVVPPTHLGNADARNYGVAQSCADYVAFLDDDDLWLPRKLEVQMRVARATRYAYPVISCRMVARAESQDFYWPRRQPRVAEPLCEYLFCRRSPFVGEGIVQTSTIFTTSRLVERVAFASGLRRYVELDWMLRAAQLDGFGVEFPNSDEPLSVWHMEENRSRITNGADGAYALTWVRERRHLLTSDAYGAFILWMVSDTAARGGDRRAFWSLLREAYRHGRVRPVDLLTHVANFSLPRDLRRRIAAWVAHWRQPPLPAFTQRDMAP